ncbi:MAG: site-specific integrase [Prevotella sp.]|jgi:site-specific recombinase XerD|nr:site-specific integrase [Prevotella sp.]
MLSIKKKLDTRKPTKDGSFGVRILIYYKGKCAQIPTSVYLHTNEWDEINCKVINRKDRNTLNMLLDNLHIRIQNIALSALNAGTLAEMNVTEVKHYIQEELNPELKEKKEAEENKPKDIFKENLDRFVSLHPNQRTQDLYKQTWRAIQKFDPNAEKLTFSDINKEWLERFFNAMEATSPSVNARNIHLRNIRAVFNDAIDNEIITVYPFRKFKIRNTQTRKRNIPAEYIREIFEEHEENASIQKALDMFKLTFLLIGINTVDLCNLTDISNGRIEYNRAKTHRFYSIKVEPEAMNIINKYRGKTHLLNLLDTVKSSKEITKFVNSRLQMYTGYLNITNVTRLGKKRQIRRYNTKYEALTTYYARHSWATIAASLDIPKETIAAALGHGGNSVTDIYIEFDQRKVDAANRKVIDFVLYGKK